jgi:hypothetical protein
LCSGVFRFFLYTWWLFPRPSDPEMSMLSRIVCCVLSLLLGILCLVLMGNDGIKYRPEISAADQNDASWFSTLPLWGQTALRTLIVMTFQESTKRIIRVLMAKVHSFSQQDQGTIKKTVLLLPRLVVTVILLIFITTIS